MEKHLSHVYNKITILCIDQETPLKYIATNGTPKLTQLMKHENKQKIHDDNYNLHDYHN